MWIKGVRVYFDGKIIVGKDLMEIYYTREGNKVYAIK